MKVKANHRPAAPLHLPPQPAVMQKQQHPPPHQMPQPAVMQKQQHRTASAIIPEASPETYQNKFEAFFDDFQDLPRKSHGQSYS